MSIESNKAITKKALDFVKSNYRYTEARLGRQWIWNKKCCGQRMYTVYFYTTEDVNKHCTVHKTTEQVYGDKGQVCACPTCTHVDYSESSYYY